MTPEELIAWHAHQITFLPDGDNVMVKHHRDAMRCVERLRAEVAALTARFSEIAPCDPGDISELISARACARYREVLAERDRLRAELAFVKEANDRFLKRQDWWTEQMFTLEQERDRLRELLLEGRVRTT